MRQLAKVELANVMLIDEIAWQQKCVVFWFMKGDKHQGFSQDV